MFENYDDILTVEEACEALKVGYNAMYALLNTGELSKRPCVENSKESAGRVHTK